MGGLSIPPMILVNGLALIILMHCLLVGVYLCITSLCSGWFVGTGGNGKLPKSQQESPNLAEHELTALITEGFGGRNRI